MHRNRVTTISSRRRTDAVMPVSCASATSTGRLCNNRLCPPNVDVGSDCGWTATKVDHCCDALRSHGGMTAMSVANVADDATASDHHSPDVRRPCSLRFG